MQIGAILRGVFLEIASWLFIRISFPVGWFPERERAVSGNSQGKNPLLLIHGYLENRSNFIILKRRLKRDGWKYVYTINLRPPSAGIPHFAELVRRKAQRIILETGASKVDIIGHSMGGLVGRYFIKYLGGSKMVNHYICIATPHRGTKLAYLAPGKCGRQMVPGNEFLTNLNSGREPFREVSYTSIYSPHDELIFPHTSATLPTAAKNIKLDYLGHLGLITSSRCYKILNFGKNDKIV